MHAWQRDGTPLLKQKHSGGAGAFCLRLDEACLHQQLGITHVNVLYLKWYQEDNCEKTQELYVEVSQVYLVLQ
jgi:hypothetical protein